MTTFDDFWGATSSSDMKVQYPALYEKMEGVSRKSWDAALMALAESIEEDEDRPEEFDMASEAYLTAKIKNLLS